MAKLTKDQKKKIDDYTEDLRIDAHFALDGEGVMAEQALKRMKERVEHFRKFLETVN